MTMPALPSSGSTNWYAYATALDTTARGAAQVADVSTTGTATGDALKAGYQQVEFLRAPVLRCTPTVLTKWAAAVTAMKAGTRDAKILAVGDSTTMGVYGNTNSPVPDYASPIAWLTAMLDRGYLPTANGLGTPPSIVTPSDGRWTLSGGWGSTGIGPIGFGGKNSSYTTSGSGTLVYADPRINADAFDVYVVCNPGLLGVLQITATGGATVTADTGNAPLATSVGVFKVTVTAAAAAYTNSVSMAWSSGGPVFVVGVEPYLASGTARSIRVGNAGSSGSDTTTWTDASQGAYGGVASIRAYAPDLTIFNLQNNDAAAGLAVATHRSQLQALVTAAQVSGDVILMSTNPSATDATSTLERQYTADEKAAFTSAGYLDYLAVCGSWTRYNGLGYVYDDLHPNAKGYEHMGRLIADVVRRIV